jgi:hypothetical protein
MGQMISIWWAVAALFVGAFLGVLLCAICAASHNGNGGDDP